MSEAHFSKGDIVRALVSTDPDDPIAIRKGNFYKICTRPQHRNSGVVFIKDIESGNVIREYSSSYFEPVSKVIDSEFSEVSNSGQLEEISVVANYATTGRSFKE